MFKTSCLCFTVKGEFMRFKDNKFRFRGYSLGVRV